MSTARVMSGIVDYSKTTNPNGIYVDRMAPRKPGGGPRYFVRCTRCGSKWVCDHQKLSYLSCQNQTCRRAWEDANRASQKGKSVSSVRSEIDPDGLRHYLDSIEEKR